MIVEAIAEVFMGIILGMFGLIPDPGLTFPDFGPFIGVIQQFDSFLPVSEVIDYTLTVIRVIMVLLGVKVLIWLYGLLPLKSS